MLKPIPVLLVLGLGGYALSNVVLPARAATVEAAGKVLSETEVELKGAATETASQAHSVATTLDGPNRPASLPQELQEFVRSTERLAELRRTLAQDIASYQTAYVAKLAEFDKERAAIADPSTQRSILVLRRHVEQDMHDRSAALHAALDQLDTVLAKGADLQHAAHCVLIADDLHAHGEDLDAQLTLAKQAANQYAVTTDGLLTRISQALVD